MQDIRIDTETATVPLAEILSAFSYALDITEGQPEGHSIRCSWIAVRMGRAVGLTGADLRDLYYSVLLKDLGCSSNAARISEIYGDDDRGFKAAYKLVDGSLPDTLAFVFRRTGAGQPFLKRASAIANILVNGPDIARGLINARCTQGADIARRLRFSDTVAESIYSLDERWDGSGKPKGLKGHAIPLGARIALLAQVVDIFFHTQGPDAALDAVAARSGTWLDPELCRAFEWIATQPDFWSGLVTDNLSIRLQAMDIDSGGVAVDDDYLDDITAAFGAVIDAKSPYTAGHSDRVGDYTDAVAKALGLRNGQRRALVRAARLHDIGKLGVSSQILEKPGKLDADEWHVMQNHAALTTQILGRITALGDIAQMAGAHHERLDGAGYPHGRAASEIALSTRIISVADFYDALTADRPYREAMPQEKALAIMEGEVGKAIDGTCFEALRQAV